MKYIPSRDITGVCEGECRNIIVEANEKRQQEINSAVPDSVSPPSVSWARSRNEAPGFLGGHV